MSQDRSAPMPKRKTKRKLAAIFFSDMKGFSSQMDADEAGTLELLRQHNQIMQAQIEAQQGRVVKTVGDAFMAEFNSSVAAVACALDCQRAFAEHNALVEEGQAIRVRIGVHVGDVIIEGDDLFGEAVNVAARLEPQAPVGGVCVSQAVYDQIRRKVHARGTRREPVALKGIGEAMQLYSLWPAAEHLDIKGAKKGPTQHRRAGLYRLLLVAIPAALLGLLAYQWPWGEPENPTSDQSAKTRITSPEAPPKKARRGGVLKLAFPAPITGDGFASYSKISTMNKALLQFMLEPLIRESSQAGYRGVALKSWAITADGRELTLELRDGLTFHPHRCLGSKTGVQATSADLAFSLRVAIQEGAVKLPVEGIDEAGADVKGLETLGPLKLRARLTQATAYTEAALANVLLLPAALHGCASPQAMKQPVGTGPFRLERLSPDGRALLLRHDHYRAKDEAGHALPRLDGIQTSVLTSARVALAQVGRGELHMAGHARSFFADLLEDPQASRPKLAAAYLPSGARVETGSASMHVKMLILIPLKQEGELVSAAFRHALSKSLDREAISTLVPGLEGPLGRFLTPGLLGHGPELEPLAYAPDAARTELAAISALGREGRASLVIAGLQKDLLRTVVAQLKAAGLEVRGVEVAMSEAAAIVQERSADFFIGWFGMRPTNFEADDLAELIGAEKPAVGLADPEITRLSQQILDEPQRQKRKALYRQLEARCMEFLPWIPLALADDSVSQGLYLYSPLLHEAYDPVTGVQLSNWPLRAWLAAPEPKSN